MELNEAQYQQIEHAAETLLAHYVQHGKAVETATHEALDKAA
jgi:hypothetical protein